MAATALYARISKKDRKCGSLSNTIENQMALLRQYISEEAMCEEKQVYEFIDDGFSGTDRKRPSFMKLLAWIELGKIDTVIVKDFSRLSRDHLLISQLREKYFPIKSVRFIALLDSYDSVRDEYCGVVYPFKTLFNEYYCSDISKKVKSSLEAKKKAGEYAVARLPYGYEIEEGKVVCCEKKAECIRAIYKQRFEGRKYEDIAQAFGMTVSGVWRILHEPAYLGYHVWHRYENEYLPFKKRIKQSPDMWKIMSDKRNDIKIIDESMLSDDIKKYYKKTYRRNSARHIFHGITKCGICRKALVLDRAKKGWLCCRNCEGNEKKLIETERLYQLFFDRLQNIMELEKKGSKTTDEASEKMYFIMENKKKMVRNKKTDVEKEMFLNIFVKKIFVWENENIVIFWRFRRNVN